MSCNCPFKSPEQEDMIKLDRYQWNVTLGKEHKPMRVYRIDGCIHTKGGKRGTNELYVADRNIPKEEIKPSDLTAFEGEICWGFNVQQSNYYGKDEIRCGCHADIFCAGKQIYTVRCSFDHIAHRVMDTILKLKEECPIPFGEIDFEKWVIGKNIWWRDQPARIKSYDVKDGTVLIQVIGSDTFQLSNRDKTEDDWVKEYATEAVINDDILANSIDWFRDETKADIIHDISENIINGLSTLLRGKKISMIKVSLKKEEKPTTPNLLLQLEDKDNLLADKLLNSGISLEFINSKEISIDDLIADINRKLMYI